MKKKRFSIGNKIILGFFSLIIIFTVIATIVVITNSKNNQLIEQSSTNIRPSVSALQEFKHLVTQSKMLVTNWVYLQSNDTDKKALKDLHNVGYPNLKEKLSGLKLDWEIDTLQQEMDSIFIEFEALLKTEQDNVMSQLVTFDHYEDPFIKLTAAETIESEVLPRSASIMKSLGKINDIIVQTDQEQQLTIRAESDNLTKMAVISAVIVIIVGLVGGFLLARSITKPINYIKDIIVKLGEGDLPDDQSRKFNNDEIGEMAEAVENLVNGLKSTSSFAENIGKGNYDAEFAPLSEKDVLGNSLIEMRDNLKSVAEEDKRRNWSTSGLATFGEILRKNNDNIEKLSDDIITNLVKYLNCNQGGLYIINQENEEEPCLELKACYAWDKKKYLEQRVLIGEGLTGQCWLEKDTVYLTEVPDDYITITSGLGEANPTSILIVPLKINDEVFGVMEIASFNEFESYEIEFVEKIAESIASTVSSVKINEKTQRLLEESTEMTEQMRSQEEEMRQNMEELQATQEEMQRSQSESQGILNAINSSLASVEFKPNGEIVDANQQFLSIFGFTLEEIRGKNHSVLLPPDERKAAETGEFWEALTQGQVKSGEFERVKRDGSSIWIRSNYSPVKNSTGEVTKVLALSFDLSDYKK
ncbi:PAS domain-containing protein [Fulvivirgaceae bacterium BMA12]|uniref:PAS domain-containing protein n=1 Tax=Agaribacillus aureus TaxID=3051825 RepID=A0ABT8L527_9BACT|nr:PAS domain-containing protein [Fulvivirgaceae bacterium BMA12]